MDEYLEGESAMSGIDVAVIPAAGRGTRLRPATRSVPKALVPVVDRPAIQYAVEEAARAGATEVYVVVDAATAPMIETHFGGGEPLPGLEGVQVQPIVQPAPLGLGDAVACAREAVGSRLFFCLLADNLVAPGRDVLGEAVRASDGRSVLCLRRVTGELLSAYGVVAMGAWRSDRILDVVGAVEKPGPASAPSDLGIMGRYLFHPEVFDALADVDPGHGDEVQLTDAIAALAAAGRCLGMVCEHDLLDIGTPYGLVHASTVLGAANPEWGDRYTKFINGMSGDASGDAV